MNCEYRTTGSRDLRTASKIRGPRAVHPVNRVRRVPYFQLDDVFVFTFAAFTTIAAIGDDVRFVTVFTRMFVHIRITPGIHRNFFLNVWPVPTSGRNRLDANARRPSSVVGNVPTSNLYCPKLAMSMLICALAAVILLFPTFRKSRGPNKGA